MTPHERAQCDPVFRRVVEFMLSQLRECNMTATEIREAAILAAQIHESTTMRPLIIQPDEPGFERFKAMWAGLKHEGQQGGAN